ncbi:MAG: hypothetical protein EBS51_04200 [Planctomycetia bacterium]|nr:hypothetical protein [Planctomycetia bacterium]
MVGDAVASETTPRCGRRLAEDLEIEMANVPDMPADGWFIARNREQDGPFTAKRRHGFSAPSFPACARRPRGQRYLRAQPLPTHHVADRRDDEDHGAGRRRTRRGSRGPRSGRGT